MYPYLFGVKALPMYGILLATGLLSAMLLFKLICALKKVDDDTYTFYSLLGIISIALGILGAILFQSFYDMIDRLRRGLGFSIKFEGMTFMGGLIVGAASFIVGSAVFAKGKVKRNFFACASYAAPCIVLGHMFGRLGCFCAGCCYGKRTDNFLGMKFPDFPYKVYPTQLFEVAFLAVLLACMLVLLLRYNDHKIMLPLYGTAYAVFRFLIEFIRGDDRGSFVPGLSPSQMQVLLLALVAVALAVLVYKFRIIPFANAKDPPPKATPSASADTASDGAPADASTTARGDSVADDAPTTADNDSVADNAPATNGDASER